MNEYKNNLKDFKEQKPKNRILEFPNTYYNIQLFQILCCIKEQNLTSHIVLWMVSLRLKECFKKCKKLENLNIIALITKKLVAL